MKKEKKKLYEYTTHMYMYHENEHDSAKKKQKDHGPDRSTEKPVQNSEVMIIYIIKLAQGPVFQKGVDFGES